MATILVVMDNRLDWLTRAMPVVDLRGGGTPGACHPSTAQNFLNFIWFFGKLWQNHRLAPPPTGNPGSVPAGNPAT